MALKKKVVPKETLNPIESLMQQKELEPVVVAPRRGRPTGKRSSDEYVVTTLVLRRDLKLDAQDKARRSGQDLSVVVNELLEQYVNT